MVVGVLTDTTASIPPQLAQDLQIELVPYYVMFGSETYRDSLDLQTDDFARYLENATVLPTTSNPSPGDYVVALQRLAERTYEIVALTMTSRGSGAYQSCLAAIEMISEKMPELRVELIDTRNVAMAQGLAAIEAARVASQGLKFKDVVNHTLDVIRNTTMIQTADTLRYLYMGGRIGRAQHLVGSMLNIKPLIGMEDGVIVALGTARTRARAYARMVELVRQRIGAAARLKVAYTHVAALNKLEMLREQFQQQFECAEVFISSLSPALAVHSGPGTVGLSVYKVGE